MTPSVLKKLSIYGKLFDEQGMCAYHSDASSHSPRRQVLAEVCSHHPIATMCLHHTTPDHTMFAWLQVTPFCVCVIKKTNKQTNRV